MNFDDPVKIIAAGKTGVKRFFNLMAGFLLSPE